MQTCGVFADHASINSGAKKTHLKVKSIQKCRYCAADKQEKNGGRPAGCQVQQGCSTVFCQGHGGQWGRSRSRWTSVVLTKPLRINAQRQLISHCPIRALEREVTTKHLLAYTGGFGCGYDFCPKNLRATNHEERPDQRDHAV